MLFDGGMRFATAQGFCRKEVCGVLLSFAQAIRGAESIETIVVFGVIYLML